MIVLRTLHDIQAAAARLGRPSGLGGALIPTMGALHAGHEALIALGVELACKHPSPSGCIVSIFVNPTQFNDPADLARYPRMLDADLELCASAGAAMVFAPDLATIYPRPPAPPILAPPLPEVARLPELEDAYRPGHFAGVCQVVLRLFNLLQPTAAVFGEKDWQQLQIIRAITSAAALPIQIIPHPTVREPGGLAMSSRNRFLAPHEREAALAIPRALAAAQAQTSPVDAQNAMERMLADAGLTVEYAVVRDAATLGPVNPERQGRALIAARAGTIRLIDNAPWPRASRAADSSPKL